LLTPERYQKMSLEEKSDRQHFWNLYRVGLDRLSYNAARFYYNQFTNTRKWTKLTLCVMDFDSMTPDDYIGIVDIPLPNPLFYTTSVAITNLARTNAYHLKGGPMMLTHIHGSTIHCSISWLELSSSSPSRMQGVWRVTIEKATNLPPMDVSMTSDPYCIVMATDNSHKHGIRRKFHQRTCIKTRTLNPQWNETIDVPVVKSSHFDSIFVENGLPSTDSMFTDDKDMYHFFQWDEKSVLKTGLNKKNMKRWSDAMKTA